MIWFIILAGGLLTFGIRLIPILLLGRLEIPSRLSLALSFVPTAVLTAIIVPELLAPGGSLDLTPGNERLIAGLIAIVIAWRTKNVLLTLAAGMAALWGLQLF